MTGPWIQTAGVLNVLDHLDSSYLHMEATLNLSFCVAVRVARTIWQCSLPLVHLFATFIVNSNAGPSLICSGPSLDDHTGQCWEQEVSGGLGCFHWALAAFSREISICHFASHPCGLTNYPLHLHPSPNFTLPSRDSQYPNLFGVLLSLAVFYSLFYFDFRPSQQFWKVPRRSAHDFCVHVRKHR